MTGRRVFARGPFTVPSFRFQWPADLLTSWAGEMEGIILGWYIIVTTGSVVLLTLYSSLQFMGTLFSPLFGVLGDRVGARNLLCLMRTAYFAFAATFMSLAFTGLLNATYVLIVAGAMGLVRSSDLVMRNQLIGASMPPALLVGAASVMRTTQDSARIAGSLAGAGLFAALGMGRSYVVIATLYALSAGLTLGAYRQARSQPQPPFAPWRELTEGFVYVWQTPTALSAMALAVLVNFTAFPFSYGLLPYVAREIYRIDQTGLGLLIASFATGSLAGSVFLIAASRLIRPARLMLTAIVAWYATLLVFVLFADAGMAIPVLAIAGLAQSLGMVPMSVILLRTSDVRYRGRVMGVRMLAVYALPLGLLSAGALIERIGFVATALLYCVVGLGLVALIALRWRSALWAIDGAANRRA